MKLYYTNAKKWIKHEYTDANKRSYLLEKRTEYQTLTETWIKQNLNINHQTKRHTSNVNINQTKSQHKSTQKEEIKLLRPQLQAHIKGSVKCKGDQQKSQNVVQVT